MESYFMPYKVAFPVFSTAQATPRCPLCHGDKEDCRHGVLVGDSESAESSASGCHEVLG